MAAMRERERRSGFNSVLVLVSVSVLFFFLFSQVITKQRMFVPGPSSYQADESILMVPSGEGGQLAVFWGPSPGAKKTVFYFHGNGEDLGQVMFILNNYRLKGVNVLSFDYRGYGLSGGKASEKNTYRDANTVLDYAVANLGVDPAKVILHGRSLGGGVAMELAMEREVAGLVLESTFLSVYRLYIPMSGLPGDKFVNYKKAGKVKCPTLLIHGRADELVPFAQGEELATFFPEGQVKTLWIEGVGHNDLVDRAGATYWTALRVFLSGL